MVTCVYRRSRAEMPAREEEIENAEEEGIEFSLLTNPVRILGNEQGWVTGMECIQMELGEPDESGRCRPVPIKGSEFVMEVEQVIIAIGQGANPLWWPPPLPAWRLTNGGISSLIPPQARPARKGSMLVVTSSPGRPP